MGSPVVFFSSFQFFVIKNFQLLWCIVFSLPWSASGEREGQERQCRRERERSSGELKNWRPPFVFSLCSLSLLFFISFPIFSSAAALRPVTSELVSLFLSVLLNNNRNVCFHSSKRNKKSLPSFTQGASALPLFSLSFALISDSVGLPTQEIDKKRFGALYSEAASRGDPLPRGSRGEKERKTKSLSLSLFRFTQRERGPGTAAPSAPPAAAPPSSTTTPA